MVADSIIRLSFSTSTTTSGAKDDCTPQAPSQLVLSGALEATLSVVLALGLCSLQPVFEAMCGLLPARCSRIAVRPAAMHLGKSI